MFVVFMRVIAKNTIKDYWEKYPKTEQSLKSWIQEVEQSDWDSPQLMNYPTASRRGITSP